MNFDFIEKRANKKAKFIIIILGILILLGLEVFNFAYYKKKLSNLFQLDLAPTSESYTYIDVSLMTDYFGTYGSEDETDYFYFVMDDKYAYIAALSNTTFKQLNEIYDYSYSANDNEKAPKSVRIYGTSKYIPNDLKKIAIESYNEIFNIDTVNDENFNDYLGYYYLDNTETPKEDFIIFSIIDGVLLVVMLFVLKTCLSNKKRVKNNIEKYRNEMNKIKYELNQSNTIFEKKARIYLTDNYIVSLINDIQIIKYDEIRWIYPHELRYNGVVTQKNIYIVLNDNSLHCVANISASKKNIARFNELYESICIKCPNAMYGFTKENIETNKQLSKSKKA